MRDVVKGIDRQLCDPVLAGKQFENLSAQAEALEIIKLALEKLKANSKKIETDLVSFCNIYGQKIYFEKIP